jgi:transaldolase
MNVTESTITQQNNPLRALNASGQSVWYDNIHRAMLGSGELARLIKEDDLRGVTSNPSIFDQAISGSREYDEILQRELRLRPGQSSRELFFSLASDDIAAAAGLLLPVYQATGYLDGMVSLEVSPDLAYDTEATIREARSLRVRLGQPNVMIKVPATGAGLPAIEQLIAEGISINVTLLFSVERYLEVADAYLRGLERRHARGQPLDRVASVASFFVSRLDNILDPLLEEKRPELQGKLAIANAKVAYRRYRELCQSERFATLARAGARPQRLLWASTSTKNPVYRDVLYIEELIGPGTVNTVPPATYEAFRDHGVVEATLERDVDTAEARLASLSELGVDLAAITNRLETEGVRAFVNSFDNLLADIEAKASALTGND